jgi:glycosyltransferase involved in cell wall biosynthesis/SAM-dependent methyltransferase
MLRECVSSILADTYDVDYELIVWDNASTDGTAEYLDEVAAAHPQVRVVHHGDNIGINGIAAGMRLARGEYLLAVDDDVVHFPPGWLDEMVRAFESVPRAGYLATNVVQDEATNGAKPTQEHYHAVDYGSGVVIEHGPTGGWCTITSRDVVERIGGFLEMPGRAFYGADGDFAQRCTAHGYRVGLVRAVRVYHAAGVAKSKEYGHLDLCRQKYSEDPEYAACLAATLAAMNDVDTPSSPQQRSDVSRRSIRELHEQLVVLETELRRSLLLAQGTRRARASRRARGLAGRFRAAGAKHLPETLKPPLRGLRRVALRSRLGDRAPRPLTVFQDSVVAHRFLDGLVGIEIGASAHNAFHIPGCLTVDYTDEPTVFTAEQERLMGEVARVDIVSPGDDLPLPDASLDYVLSSHVLEHFHDPIGALKEWARVVRPGGYLFMIIPHRDRTPDRERALTTVAELKRRHEACSAGGASAEFAGERDIHHSVWTTQTFLGLCVDLGLQVVYADDVDDKVGNGFTVVIRR